MGSRLFIIGLGVLEEGGRSEAEREEERKRGGEREKKNMNANTQTSKGKGTEVAHSRPLITIAWAVKHNDEVKTR